MNARVEFHIVLAMVVAFPLVLLLMLAAELVSNGSVERPWSHLSLFSIFYAAWFLYRGANWARITVLVMAVITALLCIAFAIGFLVYEIAYGQAIIMAAAAAVSAYIAWVLGFSLRFYQVMLDQEHRTVMAARRKREAAGQLGQETGLPDSKDP